AGLGQLTLAHARIAGGAHDEAAVALVQAERMLDQVGDRQHLNRVHVTQARLAELRGEREWAIAIATRAAEDAGRGGWSVSETWATLLLADLDEAGAAGHLDAADSLVDRLQLPQLRYAHRLRLGRHRRRSGDPGGAVDALRDAIDLAQGWGADLVDPSTRIAVRAEMAEAHDELVDVLISRAHGDDAREACRLADEAKARTLTDLVAGVARRSGDRAARHTDDDALAALQVDLSATYTALSRDIEPTRRSLMQQQAERLEREIAVERLKRTADAGPLGATSSLPAGTGSTVPTLAYHVVGDDIVVFVVSEGSVLARRLVGATGQVDRALEALDAQWQRFQVGAEFARRNERALAATALHALQDLYRLVVEPVRPLLEELSDEELVVVPHRRLHQLPFHALHDGRRYLNERWTTTITPTIGSGPRELVLAPGARGVVVSVSDDQVPTVAAEVDRVAQLLPGADVLAGEAATIARLAAEVPGAALVHVACHGLFRAANPMFSALRLADRWVTTAEFLDLDLRGSLVTLSACESGRTAHESAEPVGLAWAFLAAGAGGAIVSQWLVDDTVTAATMSDLYESLVEGTAPARALRAARSAAAERHEHPFHWAPFTYVGASIGAGEEEDRHGS
ncbi:MAG: CHAT domain-containing protein, partial [Acidimicrobiia bacterium]|nr:CHAT domain-containing protein [Acidimicrobiia bacterium]